MKPLYTLLLVLCFGVNAHAKDDTTKAAPVISRFYIGTSLDGLIFSTAFVDYNSSEFNGKLRFTAFLNIGATFNLNISRTFGVYTGIDIKNVGFIMDDPIQGGTAKYRTYNVGIPVGFKVGNMAPGRFHVFAGGGIDAPINYKEKHFQIRDQKTKFSEWFSDRTLVIMPYVFLGATVLRGFTVKVQYYPTNFFNSDFIDNGSKPYDNFNVNLLLFSLGRSLPLYRKSDIITRRVTSLKKQ